MALTQAQLDELTAGYSRPQGMQTLHSQMLQQMINRSLETEMQVRLGHARHGKAAGNPRNGKSRKTVQSSMGDLMIDTPRDRASSFEPRLLPKRQVRLVGMEEKILTLYSKGLTRRDIESALIDLYGGDDFARLDRPGHRCGAGPDAAVADLTAGGELPDRQAGWHRGEGAAAQARDQQISIRGAVGEPARGKGNAGVIVGRERRGPGSSWRCSDRTAPTWRAGHLRGQRGWPQRLTRGGQCRVPESLDAIVHRASGAGQPALCQQRRQQRGDGSTQGDLSLEHGRKNSTRIGCFRGDLG